MGYMKRIYVAYMWVFVHTCTLKITPPARLGEAGMRCAGGRAWGGVCVGGGGRTRGLPEGEGWDDRRLIQGRKGRVSDFGNELSLSRGTRESVYLMCNKSRKK